MFTSLYYLLYERKISSKNKHASKKLFKFEDNEQCNDPISFTAVASRKLRHFYLL